jgi:hypothetical protein
VYTVYLFTQGRGEGELNQREGERGNRGEYRSKSWFGNTNMTEEIGYLQDITLINTCRKVTLQVKFFR